MLTARTCSNCSGKECSEGLLAVVSNMKNSSNLKASEAALPGLLILEPKVFRDERGFFLESYNEKTLAEVGIHERFVQDNHSFSTRNVLRGLHYQMRPQGKL